VLPLAVVPEGVRQVIARRRRRLSAAANRLLDAAAGIEGPFLYEPVRAAAGLSDADALAALDDVLAAGLVAPDAAPDRYAFTHALVRGAVHHGLNPSRRLRLHRDLAAALADARAAGAPVSASEIAVQYHRAVPLPGVDAGVGPALEAAELARATGAHDQEVTFLRIADDVLAARRRPTRRPAGPPRRGTGLVAALRRGRRHRARRCAGGHRRGGDDPGHRGQQPARVGARPGRGSVPRATTRSTGPR
jgi:hypothetical protein